MREQVKLNVFYPHPAEKIWQALTDRRILNAWMMKNDFEPCIGHKFKFESNSLPGLEATIYCEVIELNEPKRLAYTWQDSNTAEASLVIWTLTPVEGGTQLELRHRQAGYATTIVGDRHENLRDFNHPTSLFLSQQSPNFDRQTLPIGLHPWMAQDRHILLNQKDSKNEWDYRLNQKLLQALQNHC